MSFHLAHRVCLRGPGSSAGFPSSQDVAGVILAAGMPDVKACFLETNFDAVADFPFFGNREMFHITAVPNIDHAV